VVNKILVQNVKTYFPPLIENPYLHPWTWTNE